MTGFEVPAGLPNYAVGMIWAQTRDGVIGRGGTMPWNAPEDMAHFKAVTMGHPVVMGRRTWESIQPRFRPFSGRTTIVITSSDERAAEIVDAGAQAAKSLDEALVLAASSEGGHLTWVIGGGQIYAETASLADVAAITVLDLDVADGDTFAPALPPQFELTQSQPEHDFTPSERGPGYRFETWVAGNDSL